MKEYSILVQHKNHSCEMWSCFAKSEEQAKHKAKMFFKDDVYHLEVFCLG